MLTRLLFSEEDDVRKKKTLVLVMAFLLILSLLGLYAAVGPQGGLIAGTTPTVSPSLSAVASVTSMPTSTATPTASAVPVAKATATPVVSKPTVVLPATSVALEPTPTLEATVGATSEAEATATLPSALTLVPPEPTASPTALATFGPTPSPTIVPIASLAAPVITTPSDGSVLKDDRLTIAGTAPPNATIQVYDDGTLVGTMAADAQGSWASVPGEPLEPGEHTVTAVASDEAGRKSAPSVAVTFTIVIERLPTAGGSWFERWLDRLSSIVFP